MWSEKIKKYDQGVVRKSKKNDQVWSCPIRQSMTKFVVVRGQVCGQVCEVGQIKSGVSPHDAGHGN